MPKAFREQLAVPIGEQAVGQSCVQGSGDAARRNGSGRPRRVMIYSQDGLGLGHLRRTSTIAARLSDITPGTAILTCMDSPAGPFFRPVAGQDHLRLPGIVKDGPGRWRAEALPIGIDQAHQMRADLLLAAAQSFEPDLLLVDHMPHGAQGELLPTLRHLRSKCPATSIVLGLRDILDDPEVVARVWAGEGAAAALDEFYDLMLIYGAQEVFDAGAIYGFDSILPGRTVYAGYVGHQGNERLPKERDRERALIFAMAGGGADAYPMLRAVVDAFPAINDMLPSTLVVATGPFLPDDLGDDIRARARALGPHVKVKATVKDPWRYLRWSDAVVAMAGYNSSVEILLAGCPAVLVPRPGPSAEQRMRASLFAEKNWVGMVDPSALDPQAMAAAVVGCLTGDRYRRQRPSAHLLNGRDTAASCLGGLLSGAEIDLARRSPRPRPARSWRRADACPDPDSQATGTGPA
jgi:predicted glycosyltransferase